MGQIRLLNFLEGLKTDYRVCALIPVTHTTNSIRDLLFGSDYIEGLGTRLTIYYNTTTNLYNNIIMSNFPGRHRLTCALLE